MKTLFLTLALAAGIAVAIQAAMNAGLSKRLDLGTALLINSLIILIPTLGLWFGQGAKTNFFPAGTPWHLYLAGIFGFCIIAFMAYIFPKLGAAYTICLMVLGQGIAAMLIDHFGLLGMPKNPINLTRVLGLVLIVAGVVVFQWKSITQAAG